MLTRLVVVLYYCNSTHLSLIEDDIIAYTLLYIGVLVGPDLGSSETRARYHDPYPCRFGFSDPLAPGPRVARLPLSQCDRFCCC